MPIASGNPRITNAHDTKTIAPNATCPRGDNRSKPPHSHPAMAAISAANQAQPSTGRKKSADRKTASRTTAVMTRVLSIGIDAAYGIGDNGISGNTAGYARMRVSQQLFAGASEAALAAAIGGNGLVERCGIEFRP